MLLNLSEGNSATVTSLQYTPCFPYTLCAAIATAILNDISPGGVLNPHIH